MTHSIARMWSRYDLKSITCTCGWSCTDVPKDVEAAWTGHLADMNAAGRGTYDGFKTGVVVKEMVTYVCMD